MEKNWGDTPSATLRNLRIAGGIVNSRIVVTAPKGIVPTSYRDKNPVIQTRWPGFT